MQSVKWLLPIVRRGTRQRWEFGLGLLVGMLFVHFSSRYVSDSIDDFYIVLRYAENAAAGHGFVFNLGERVEGFTCFGWVALLAGLVRMGWPAYWAAKFFGLLCGGITLWLVYRIGREFWRDDPREKLFALIPSALLALNPGFLYWSVAGLETALFTTLVFSALLLVVIESRLAREKKSARWGASGAQGLICFFAVLVRPEGFVLFGFVCLSKLLMADFRKDLFEQALLMTVLCLVPVGFFFLWRFSYFGDWLPNTYQAKMGGASIERLLSGRLYLYGAFAENAFGWLGFHGQTALPGFLLFWFIPAVALPFVRRKRAHGILLGWMFLDTAATIWKGGDWMAHFRFLQPSLVCWLLLLSHALVCFSQRCLSMKRFYGWIAISASMTVLLFLGVDQVHRNLERQPVVYFDHPGSWPNVFARYMLNVSADGVLAASDIGLLGYLTGYRVIDMVGLIDKHIARSPGNSFQKDYDPAYVLDQKPDFVILQGHRCLPEERLFAHPQFDVAYREVLVVGGHRLFERKDGQ